MQGRPHSSLQRLLWADPCLHAKAYCVQTLTCLQTPAESGSLRACQRAGHADADIKHPCVAPERVPASFCTEVHARSPMPVSGDVCTLRYPRLCRYHEQIKTLRQHTCVGQHRVWSPGLQTLSKFKCLLCRPLTPADLGWEQRGGHPLRAGTLCKEPLCVPQFPLLERDPPLLESLLLVPAVRGSGGSRESGLHTPSTRWVRAVDSGMQGWGQGLPPSPQPSWKPRGQVQRQVGPAGSSLAAGGFPETEHSSCERFPGLPGPTRPRGTLGRGVRPGVSAKEEPGPACTCPHGNHWGRAHTPRVCVCESCSAHTSVCAVHTHRLALVGCGLTIQHRRWPQGPCSPLGSWCVSSTQVGGSC